MKVLSRNEAMDTDSIVIYGVGDLGHRCYKTLSDWGVGGSVKYFVDGKCGGGIPGVEVKSPDVLGIEKREIDKVIVASTAHAHEIVERLICLGVDEERIYKLEGLDFERYPIVAAVQRALGEDARYRFLDIGSGGGGITTIGVMCMGWNVLRFTVLTLMRPIANGLPIRRISGVGTIGSTRHSCQPAMVAGLLSISTMKMGVGRSIRPIRSCLIGTVGGRDKSTVVFQELLQSA